MTIESFEAQIYPDLGPAHLTGYSGMSPGPTFLVEKDNEIIARFLNKGATPAAVHLHGSPSHATFDGWAEDTIEVGQFKDYYWPSRKGRTLWYHDHAEDHTAENAYFGQAGAVIIHDATEDSLGIPSGDYDIPLAITDKLYKSNGDLASPMDSTIGFLGDIIQVNGQPWPYLAVEPRKYRLRVFDMSLSRPYNLYFEDVNGYTITFQVIASDSGLFGSPVSTSDMIISPGERYEVVVDFSAYSGQNVTFKNNLQIPLIEEYDNTDKIMMFSVGNTVTDSSNNDAIPSTLNANIDWPKGSEAVDHVFEFQQSGDQWLINGVSFMDVNSRILAKPQMGDTELWELRHTGGPSIHPVHIHLVDLQIVSRTGGSRGVLPYESGGLKDTVLLEPGEIVQVRAMYGPWNGLYMFHCHNLIHEDNGMMAAYNITLIEDLGYDVDKLSEFADPMNPKFRPQDYSDKAYAPDAVSSAVAALASLNPYKPALSLISAEQAYYATAGSNDKKRNAAPTTTIPQKHASTASPGNTPPKRIPRKPRAERSPINARAPMTTAPVKRGGLPQHFRA